MTALRTYALTKYYGKTKGIESLDLQVERGEVFGFLGPNGAGKTTTIRLLLGLLAPTSGRAEVLGLDMDRHSQQIRRRIGYIPGDVFFYDGLSGQEMLDLLSHLHSGSQTTPGQELAECLDLDLRRKIRTYSRGMKQKLAIIQALMNRPELLILDEPTLGLDPLMQHEFYKLLMAEKERGATIFLSSHILPEVERACDRVGIVRDGRLVAIEDVAQLKRKKVRRMELTLAGEVAAGALEMEGVELLHRDGNRLVLAVHGNVGGLLQRLAGLPVEDLVFAEATLEDTFMKFYGHEEKS